MRMSGRVKVAEKAALSAPSGSHGCEFRSTIAVVVIHFGFLNER